MINLPIFFGYNANYHPFIKQVERHDKIVFSKEIELLRMIILWHTLCLIAKILAIIIQIRLFYKIVSTLCLLETVVTISWFENIYGIWISVT